MNAGKESLLERANTGLHAALLRHLPDSIGPNARILDVGCGTGAWLGRLCAAGFRDLHGLDADIDQTAFAGGRFSQCDLNQAAWPVSGEFRLITAIEVIEHLDNIGFFLDNIRRHLADDGFCLMTTPNVESIAARLRFIIKGRLKQFDEIGDQTHITPLFHIPANRVFIRHGLSVARIWGFPESGETLSSRRMVNFASRILRHVLAESVPGDNLCLLLSKSGQYPPIHRP